MNFQLGSFSSMLKEGSRHLSGVDEATARNIEAIVKLSQITKTSMGPYGMNKIVLNHLDKLFVTHDAATIIQELEVVHPAAKMVVMASQAQEREVGDHTNYVVVFAGELMSEAENLLRMGLHPSDIIEGFSKAAQKALELLPGLTVKTVEDMRKEEDVVDAIRATIAAKQYGYEDLLAGLVTKACLDVLPARSNHFNVDNVRVAKIEGGAIEGSLLLKGLVLPREPSGTVRKVTDAKIAVYGCSFDAASTETKGTVLIQNAEELLQYNKSEERAMEEVVKGLSEAGVNVVVSGGAFGELAIHYLNRYNIMAVKVASKFDQRRLCRAVSATFQVRLAVPPADSLGWADEVVVEEVGDKNITVFRRHKDSAKISTIVLRGATSNILDGAERAIDDGVNAFKSLAKDGRLLAGAGAVEIELAARIAEYADSAPGLDQYAIRKFASAFEVVPRVLAESAGFDSTVVVSNLHAAHKAGKSTFGVDMYSADGLDAVQAKIFDTYESKFWAIKLASDAVLSVLRVDQIIMAKPAGGPKMRDPGPRDEE